MQRFIKVSVYIHYSREGKFLHANCHCSAQYLHCPGVGPQSILVLAEQPEQLFVSRHRTWPEGNVTINFFAFGPLSIIFFIYLVPSVQHHNIPDELRLQSRTFFLCQTSDFWGAAREQSRGSINSTLKMFYAPRLEMEIVSGHIVYTTSLVSQLASTLTPNSGVQHFKKAGSRRETPTFKEFIGSHCIRSADSRVARLCFFYWRTTASTPLALLVRKERGRCRRCRPRQEQGLETSTRT
jgi:hypothetical protein